MSNTLHFHLGPVQAFVASARRTRDIWAGSFLLSWLAARAAAAALNGADAEHFLKPLSATSEPIFVAALDLQAGREASVAPFLGTFPNHFELADADDDAARRATSMVRTCWAELGLAVESFIFDMEVGGAKLSDKYPEARKIFRQQIGSPIATPYWEIYSISVDELKWRSAFEGCKPVSPLSARKTLRWADDTAARPAIEHGAFCSMAPGEREISGVVNVNDSPGREQRRVFWTDVRAAVVRRRYQRARRKLDDIECLDLRANEFLSAVALVKRLFPLLPAAELKRVVGWNPVVRSIEIDAWIETIVQDHKPAKGWAEKLFRLFAAPSPSVQHIAHSDISIVDDDSGEQSAIFWPSTSAVAAAHWLENVQRLAAGSAKKLAEQISALGPHIAKAEQNLFLRCVHWSHATPLAFVDAAHLFRATIEKGRKRDPNNIHYEIIAKSLATIEGLPHDPQHAPGRSLGTPASVYAVVRADGDSMGELIGTFPFLGKALSRFTTALRGGPEQSCGIVAEHNGVTLYASADEMIALCPVEDALDLASAVRAAYLREMTAEATSPINEESAVPLASLTISVAITFANRQVPLTWVMQSGAALLDDVAKDGVGRNGLAIEILDSGGRRLEWAAPWTGLGPVVESLASLVAHSVGDARPIGGNQFLHDVADTMRPLVLEHDELGHTNRVRYCRQLGEGPIEALAKPLLRKIVFDHLKDTELDAAAKAEIATSLLEISWLAGLDQERRQKLFQQRMSLNGLKIVRFLTENWRKYLPDAFDQEVGE